MIRHISFNYISDVFSLSFVLIIHRRCSKEYPKCILTDETGYMRVKRTFSRDIGHPGGFRGVRDPVKTENTLLTMANQQRFIFSHTSR